MTQKLARTLTEVTDLDMTVGNLAGNEKDVLTLYDLNFKREKKKKKVK